MRLLLCSDLHADRAATERIVTLSADVDVLIIAGDLGNGRRQLDVCVPILSRIPIPTVLVAGNNESPEELRIACQHWSSAVILHGTSTEINGVPFFGLGGAVPETPFGSWSYDLSEINAMVLLADCPADAVLVTHSPPKGVVDRNSRGDSLGSEAIHAAILRTRPRLLVCGHIHASSGLCERIDEIPVINAGPLGMIWELTTA